MKRLLLVVVVVGAAVGGYFLWRHLDTRSAGAALEKEETLKAAEAERRTEEEAKKKGEEEARMKEKWAVLLESDWESENALYAISLKEMKIVNIHPMFSREYKITRITYEKQSILFDVEKKRAFKGDSSYGYGTGLRMSVQLSEAQVEVLDAKLDTPLKIRVHCEKGPVCKLTEKSKFHTDWPEGFEIRKRHR